MPDRAGNASGGNDGVRIEIRNITKRFGASRALDDVSMDVEDGELVALLGPSGCGKTTLLRILSGLEFADSGTIRLDGEDASAKPSGSRRVGFVFQHYALFRHMTVSENIAFGLNVRRENRPPRPEIRRRVGELLALIKMEELGGRYPAQLSGGQRQRVALARALAVEPRVLLLDEPFGALDAGVRKDLRRWLRRLHDDLHVTSVFVTHDVEEALEVSDRVVVMNEGRVEQIGSPEEVYDKPATPFVCRFLGGVNIFHARMEEGRIAIAGGTGSPSGPGITAYARPHDIDLTRAAASGDGSLEAVVLRIRSAGPLVNVELQPSAGGAVVEVELPRDRYRELALRAGERVHIRPSLVKVFHSTEKSPSAEQPSGSPQA
jgi:sulfate transport system ATP-binding protein